MAKAQNVDNDGKIKALEVALGDLKKRFGDGAVMRLGERNELNIETIPTGCLSLDIALGVGGLPRGRFRQNYFVPARYCRSAKARRYRRFCRRGARPGSFLRRKMWGQDR